MWIVWTVGIAAASAWEPASEQVLAATDVAAVAIAQGDVYATGPGGTVRFSAAGEQRWPLIGVALAVMDVDANGIDDVVVCGDAGVSWIQNGQTSRYLTNSKCTALSVSGTTLVGTGPEGTWRRTAVRADFSLPTPLAHFGEPLGERFAYIDGAQIVEEGPRGKSVFATIAAPQQLVVAGGVFRWLLADSAVIGDATGGFVALAGGASQIGVGAADGDRGDDLWVRHGGDRVGVILAGERFERIFAVPAATRAVAWGDIDADGCGDIIAGGTGLAIVHGRCPAVVAAPEPAVAAVLQPATGGGGSDSRTLTPVPTSPPSDPTTQPLAIPIVAPDVSAHVVLVQPGTRITATVGIPVDVQLTSSKGKTGFSGRGAPLGVVVPADGHVQFTPTADQVGSWTINVGVGPTLGIGDTTAIILDIVPFDGSLPAAAGLPAPSLAIPAIAPPGVTANAAVSAPILVQLVPGARIDGTVGVPLNIQLVSLAGENGYSGRGNLPGVYLPRDGHLQFTPTENQVGTWTISVSTGLVPGLGRAELLTIVIHAADPSPAGSESGVEPVPQGVVPTAVTPEAAKSPALAEPSAATVLAVEPGARLEAWVGQPLDVQLVATNGSTKFSGRGGPVGLVVPPDGHIRFTPAADQVGVWPLSVRTTPIRVETITLDVRDANGKSQAQSTVSHAPSLLTIDACTAAAGVAVGGSYAADSWETIGGDPWLPSGSPAVAITCELGHKTVRAFGGVDSALTFNYRIGENGQGTHLLVGSAGALIGNDRFRAGPMASLGLVFAGAGVRALWLPFGRDAAMHHGFEIRALALAPSASALPSGELMLLYGFELGGR